MPWWPFHSHVPSFPQLYGTNQSFISLSSQYNDFLRMKGFRKPTITVQTYNIECIRGKSPKGQYLGTRQRSPVGPGWPFFESPQCEHINGVVFTARAGWGLPIVEGSGVVSAGGGVISGGDSVCKSGARGAVVGGSMEGGSPELKTSLWVLSGWPSLEARVTSMKSPVHDESFLLQKFCSA